MNSKCRHVPMETERTADLWRSEEAGLLFAFIGFAQHLHLITLLFTLFFYFYLHMMEKLVLSVKSSTAVTTNEGIHLFVDVTTLCVYARTQRPGTPRITWDWTQSSSCLDFPLHLKLMLVEQQKPRPLISELSVLYGGLQVPNMRSCVWFNIWMCDLSKHVTLLSVRSLGPNYMINTQ